MMCTIETGWLCNVLSNLLPDYYVDVCLHPTVPLLLTAPRHHHHRQRPAQGEEEERGRQDDTVPAATVNYLETMGWEVNNRVLFTTLWCYLAPAIICTCFDYSEYDMCSMLYSWRFPFSSNHEISFCRFLLLQKYLQRKVLRLQF